MEDVARLLVNREPEDGPAPPDPRVVQGVPEERVVDLQDGEGVVGLPVAHGFPIDCPSLSLDRVTAELSHI